MATATLDRPTLGDSKLVTRFRAWAAALDSQIEHAGRPMSQNPTPKRNRELQSRMFDCCNLERTQRALQALADAHEAGSIPDSLAGLRTKAEVAGMVRKCTDGSKGGYYSCIESDDFADKTPAARMLQELIDLPSSLRAERDRLRKIEELAAEIALSNIPGFFPTPPAVVDVMLRRARLEPGLLVLEPSAGSGNIADAVRAAQAGVAVHCIEPNGRLREILKLKGYALIGFDVTDVMGQAVYDRVIMNPPFERQQDIDHVREAYTLLKPGGVLVSVMAPSFEFRQDRKSIDFRGWLEDVGASCEDLPDGSFKASGTGVSTKLITIG